MSPRVEQMRSVLPVIEGADDGHLFCFRRPYGKVGASLTIDAAEMRTEFVVEFEVRALVEQIDVIVRQSASRVRGHLRRSVGHRFTSSLGCPAEQGISSIFHAMSRITRDASGVR